jgi:hypothetical protein
MEVKLVKAEIQYLLNPGRVYVITIYRYVWVQCKFYIRKNMGCPFGISLIRARAIFGERSPGAGRVDNPGPGSP